MRPFARNSFGRFAILLALLTAVGMPCGARAQQTHGAHEHGAGELNVALEGQELVVELLLPLDNLVGFEHAPTNDSQRAALVAAGRRLRDAGAMFALPAAAACSFGHVDIESPWPMVAPAPGQGGQTRAGDAQAQPARGNHEDVVVTYHFTCTQPQALDRLEVRAFAQFPRLRQLRVEHASARGQGATVLVPSAATLAL